MSEVNQTRKPYPSDLTDAQWKILESLVPPARKNRGGRPRDVNMRDIIDAILFVNRSGCQWDMLPHDFAPKSTVYEYFAQWREDGTWQKFLTALRTQVRVAAGREPTPSAMCIDSQSVKTTEVGGDDRGYDGGKKINGRKRHLLVDTLGLLIAWWSPARPWTMVPPHHNCEIRSPSKTSRVGKSSSVTTSTITTT